MKHISRLLLAAGMLALFTGCETTGDPAVGGLFWDENKARTRIHARERTLGNIESDTSRVERRNRRLRARASE